MVDYWWRNLLLPLSCAHDVLVTIFTWSFLDVLVTIFTWSFHDEFKSDF
jgi:hypothetical protein